MRRLRNISINIRGVAFLALLVCLFSVPAQAQPWDGNGVEGDPYLIYDACDMQAIGANSVYWDAHFKLMADIDLGGFTGTSFNIIGNDSNAFTGVFDGNGHTISNFTYKETLPLPWPILNPTLDHTDQGSNTLTNINNMFSDDFIQDGPIVIPTPNDINWTPPILPPPSFGGDGLFASVDGVGAEIKNLTLVDPNIKTFGGSIGALVGHLQNGTLNNCGVEGGIVSKIGGIFITGSSGDIGGLAGYISDGNVLNCHVSNVQLSGGTTGALTPRNKAGTISNCYATDSVVPGGSLISGGLVTVNSGIILNSYTSGSGDDCGLVGTNLGTISNCHASGSAQWAGLVGFNEGTISNCYATGTVAGNNFAGGLVSGNKGEISNCYATAAVDGNNLIGGLVGYNDGTISNCYATGPVTGDVNVGALVGYDDGGSYGSCFWDSDINPDINGIGNLTDPNIMGKSTAEMQTESTFTSVGWDFVGETVNGANDIWWINEGKAYPRLWWETIEPMELLDILAQDIINLKLQPGIENSLLVKLDTALQILEDDNVNNDVAAINTLEAFINAVEAQRGKKIPEAEADALIAAALEIIDLLSNGQTASPKDKALTQCMIQRLKGCGIFARSPFLCFRLFQIRTTVLQLKGTLSANLIKMFIL